MNQLLVSSAQAELSNIRLNMHTAHAGAIEHHTHAVTLIASWIIDCRNH